MSSEIVTGGKNEIKEEPKEEDLLCPTRTTRTRESGKKVTRGTRRWLLLPENRKGVTVRGAPKHGHGKKKREARIRENHGIPGVRFRKKGVQRNTAADVKGALFKRNRPEKVALEMGKG